MTENIRQAVRLKQIRRAAFFVGVYFFLFINFTAAQDLPPEIRGYKVHRAAISVKNETEKKSRSPEKKSEAFVRVGEPELTRVSLGGVTFELSAEIDSIEQSGTVDFLTFHDFRVNKLPVEIEEYKKSFDFKKNEPIILPKPISITVGAASALRSAVNEINDSKEEWTVTGRIFVFGRFKKSFLKFKRVVPVEINLKIKNPLKIAYHKQVFPPVEISHRILDIESALY